jgi:hypothetical protein
LPLLPGESLVSQTPATAKPLSYYALKEHHLARVKYTEDGKERTSRYLDNHNSVMNSWLKYLSRWRGVSSADGAGDLMIIGDEMLVAFTDRLANYLGKLEEDGYSQNTINDRKSIMWSVHESALDLVKTSGLPESFCGALSVLIRNSGKTPQQIADAGDISRITLKNWASGEWLPYRSSLPNVERLEGFFGVPQGALSGRLIHLILIQRDGPFETCTTPWRKHHSKLLKCCYRLNAFTPTLECEFGDAILFFTDEVWLSCHGFERNSEWRVDPDGAIPTALLLKDMLSSFFGFLTLPPDEENPWLKGMGMPPESLSLALLSDAELLLKHADFKRRRSYSQSYNNGTLCLLNKCVSWLRKETGFLRQQPRYGEKLRDPVSPEAWDQWCEVNRQKIINFIKSINKPNKKTKKPAVVMTRDPFAAVRQFIEDLEHPVSILMEMTEKMKALTPLLKKGGPVIVARHVRDTFFVEFITSYPLRIKNISRMKVSPWRQNNSSGRSLADPDDVNLYQKPNGSWWIRYTLQEMKNGVEVDVPVAASVVPLLEEYLSVHRPVLNEALKEAINRRRAKSGVELLSADEEQAIDSGPYVFRPTSSAVACMNEEQFALYSGSEPMSEDSLSRRMLRLSQRFIPNCKGFSAHAVRHLVASDYIKNRPHGFEDAAAALNDLVDTVRKHYAWVRACDKIRPWQEYHEELKLKFTRGGPVSTVAVMR